MAKYFIFFSAAFLILTTPLYAYKNKHLKNLHDQISMGVSVQCEEFDLQDADLGGLNLKGANFRGANLKGANLSQSQLQGAIFIEAKLQKTNLSHSNLSKADFTYANMNGANFRYANLNRADLAHASANGAKFKNAKLDKAKYEDAYSARGSLLADIIQKGKTNKTLDLHGGIPWKTKCVWIDKFIWDSYKKSRGAIEIITGRGLNNPDGKMGVLWRKCKRYLLGEKFKDHIQTIQSINKNGGWKIILRHYSCNRVKITKNTEFLLNNQF